MWMQRGCACFEKTTGKVEATNGDDRRLVVVVVKLNEVTVNAKDRMESINCPDNK